MKTHIVKHGDTLWKIAKHYGVNFEALKKFNKHLTNPDMMLPGQEIQIPLSGIVELIEDDNHHQKVTMKPSSSSTAPGIDSLKGLVKEVPMQHHGGMHQKEHVIHQVPMHKEVPVPHTMPTPIMHKEVPIPHTMPKEVPIQHPKHKEMPKPKKVPMHKEHPIQHIHKEQPIHFEPHFNISHPVKQQIPKQVPQQIKNDIHPEVDIHNNYYLTNMQMIEHEHVPKPKPKPKPPKKEVHHEVQKYETFTMPMQEVQMQEVQMPVVQSECVPISYEEFYVQPGCESFYGFGFEPEMMMQNQVYGGQPQYFDQMQYGLGDYGYMMRNPQYMNPYKGWGTNPYLHDRWYHNYPWMNHLGHHHHHIGHHHHHHFPHGGHHHHHGGHHAHHVHHEAQNMAAVPVMGKNCGCGCQSQTQTQHPYFQQGAIPVMGKSYGYQPHQGGMQLVNPQQTQMY